MTQGAQGMQGVRGDQGSQGSQGRPGVPGPQGNQGNPGSQGRPGTAGEVGRRGVKGPPLSRIQALSLFLMVVLIGVVMTLILSHQQKVLQDAQAKIQHNTEALVQAQYDRCIASVQFVERYNGQYDELIRIEKLYVTNKELRDARVAAFTSFKIVLPADPCPR